MRASLTTKYAAFSTGSGSRPLAERGRSTSTGTGERSAISWTAAASPWSVRTRGWMPRTVDAELLQGLLGLPVRLAQQGEVGPVPRDSSSALPSVIVSATRRCWTPSCRSRSIRRRSVSNASTSPVRERRSSATAATRRLLGRVEQQPGERGLAARRDR